MDELSDRVYKFLIAGRIVFIAAILLALILITVTAVSTDKLSRRTTMQNPDAGLLADKEDDVEVPTTGEEKAEPVEEKKEETEPAEQSNSTSQNTQNVPVRTTRTTSSSANTSTPTNNTAAQQPAKSNPEVIHYDEINYVDDNSDQLNNTDWLYTPEESSDEPNPSTEE